MTKKQRLQGTQQSHNRCTKPRFQARFGEKNCSFKSHQTPTKGQHLQEIEAFKVVSVFGVFCWLNFFDKSIDTPYQTTPLLIFTDRSSFRCVFFDFSPTTSTASRHKIGSTRNVSPCSMITL